MPWRPWRAAFPPGARCSTPARARDNIARHFAAQRYCGVDLAVGDAAWDYSRLDALADLTALPFRDGAFDAALNIVTLEHLREPARALARNRAHARAGRPLLMAAPQEWEVHQAPHDYFRYTRYGLAYLLWKAPAWKSSRCAPVGGYFRLLARRLLNGLQFFTGRSSLAGLRSRRFAAGSAGADSAVSGFLGPRAQFHAGLRLHGPQGAERQS